MFSARRSASEKRISCVPTWTSVGGKPEKSAKSGENCGRLGSMSPA